MPRELNGRQLTLVSVNLQDVVGAQVAQQGMHCFPLTGFAIATWATDGDHAGLFAEIQRVNAPLTAAAMVSV